MTSIERSQWLANGDDIDLYSNEHNITFNLDLFDVTKDIGHANRCNLLL